MHKIFTDFNTCMPFPDVFPKEWNETIPTRDYMEFRNLSHFIYVVSKIKQEDVNNCNMSYDDALNKMMRGESDFPKAEQASIRNLVRQNLFKRGLITEEVYEEYKYAVEGTQVGVDPAKYAAGEPDCIITPTRQYIDFFYELYVSVSYHWGIKNEAVRESCAKLLATVEELERQHVFIKISLVFPTNCSTRQGNNFFSYIPLFSHKDIKSVDTMSAVINDRLLRKFFFAILENYYQENLTSGKGRPVELDKAMNVGNEFDEVKFFEDVMQAVEA